MLVTTADRCEIGAYHFVSKWKPVTKLRSGAIRAESGAEFGKGFDLDVKKYLILSFY